ncbi:hypothetical protein ACT3SP_12625 [Brachybacterium sp. AOP43-C2-M15]|uniref:hypothetical protein n=1 Tax=Brachybacterium sp. AOP43-C2-M15 TaxID=3457661 RepID=UPI00403318EC
MRFTPGLAVAFGDWLECDRIRRDLVAARPEIAASSQLDPERPLLRIRRPDGVVVVARRGEEGSPAWLVGSSASPAPVLRAADTPEAAVALALDLLARPVSDPPPSPTSGQVADGQAAGGRL